jgi:hypothetical protein
MIIKLIKIFLFLVIIIIGLGSALYFGSDSVKGFINNLFGKEYGNVVTTQDSRSVGGSQIYTGGAVGNGELSAEEFEAIIQKSAFSSLPKRRVIVFSFFDGSGKMRADMNFIIKEAGKVTKGFTNDYDFRIITGDYYIDDIKASEDFCATLRMINENQDFRVEKKISMISALIIYRNVIKDINNCMGGII